MKRLNFSQKIFMRKKFLFAIALIFSVAVACSRGQDPYILSHLSQIQVLEKQDHKFCVSLKLSFDKGDNLKSGIYWRCRLSLAKYKLYTDQRAPNYAKHNLEISDLITKISLKLSNTPESILIRENKKMDDRQHKQCLIMGFVFDTEDQAKIDDYFACRKALIEDQQLVPPFGNTEYLKYPNRSYNLGFVIDRRIDEEIKRYNSEKKNYPTCIKFHFSSANFKNCVAAQNRSRQCFTEIDKKKFRREGEEKIVCQKQAYLRFPDEFLKEEDRNKRDIERMKNNSDYYNKQNFASIGIGDLSQFESKSDKKTEEVTNKKSDKNINSKEGLYSKFELTKLRQKYIFSCQQEADGRVIDYVEGLKKDCGKMIEFEVIGEE